MSSPCDTYPRVLKGLLDDSDVAFLKGLFKELAEDKWEKREKVAESKGGVVPQRVLEYFTILKHLQMEPNGQLHSIIQKLYAKVEKAFGSGFVIQQDFWSWRSEGHVAAGRIHMDGDFWITKQNDGFNLWILLEHQDMAHSFDILTKDENPELYKLLKLPGRVTSIIPSKLGQEAEKPRFLFWEPLRWWPFLFEFRSPLLRSVAFFMSWCSTNWLQNILTTYLKVRQRLPLYLLRPFMAAFGWLGNLSLLPSSLPLKPTRFNLNVGDALVVRQDELHVSDQDALKPGQYRLAVGFKFMRQAAVQQYVYTGPAAKARRQFRGLRLPLGGLLPDVYRAKGIDMSIYEDPPLVRMFAQSRIRS